MSFLSHKCSFNQFVLNCGLCTYFTISNCSLDTSTTVTKLGRHIGVIMVRPVIPHIAGIVVGYWRNGCSYRNIAREVGLHGNTVYGLIKRFCERWNFVSGRRTRRPRTTNDMHDRVLYRLARENRRFSVQRLRRAWQPYVNFAVSRKTVNRRLVARAYRARQMVKVPRLPARAKLVRRHWALTDINRPLGQWQHVILHTKVHSCSSGSTMGSMFEDWLEKPWMKIVHRVMWLTEAVLHMCGVVSLIWENPPCAFWFRCHWSRLSPSSGGTLGFTWQGMLSQQFATGWW